jgi:hypothetical protein
MCQPITKEMTAKTLGDAAIDAVRNTLRHAEEKGFQHRLADQISIGVGDVQLHNHFTCFG